MITGTVKASTHAKASQTISAERRQNHGSLNAALEPLDGAAPESCDIKKTILRGQVWG
jgi:hypothetical protein